MLPQNRSTLLAALLVVACAALALSGCGGSSPVSTAAGQNSGIGPAGVSPAAGATITIPAQTLSVVDGQGQVTGRTATTPARSVAAGKPFTLPVTISDSTGITGIGLKFTSDDGSVTCTDIVAGDVFPAQQATIVKNVTGKIGAIAMVSPMAGAKRSGAVLATLTLVANKATPTFVITGGLAGSHAENLGEINPQTSSGPVHAMAAPGVGDPLGVGKPWITDANAIMLAYIGALTPDPGTEAFYDANGDGRIDIRDANKVMLRYVGAETGAWPIVLFSNVNVTGIVRDSVTNAVVVNASVTVAGGAIAVTDSAGRFTSTNQVTGGLSAVAVTNNAYMNFSANMRIATDYNPSDIGTIFFTPNTISGTLYMPDGVTKDGGVSIEISIDSLHTVVSTTGTTAAGNLGQFTFRGIPSGNQVIIVRDQPNPASPADPLTAYKAVTIPAGGNLTGISVVLSAGPPGPPLPTL